MHVRVLFFGRLKDLAGKSGDTLELPEGATTGDVLARLESQIPSLKKALGSIAVAVNHQ